jgi:hypothetical protein
MRKWSGNNNHKMNQPIRQCLRSPPAGRVTDETDYTAAVFLTAE